MTSYLALTIVRPGAFETLFPPVPPPAGPKVGSLPKALVAMVRRNLVARDHAWASAACEG